MIMRYRWYRLNLPISHSSLLRSMKESPITINRNNGYKILENDEGEVKFQFFWREKISATTLDSEGNASSEEVFTLNDQNCTLVIVKGKFLLRLENPGRSSRELFNSLESMVGMGFYSKALSLSNENINSILEKLDVSILTGVKITGAVRSNGLVARIDLASKNGIDLEKLSMLKGMPYKKDSASYEVIMKGITGKFSYSSTGLIKISGKLYPKLLDLIEKGIKTVLLKSK